MLQSDSERKRAKALEEYNEEMSRINKVVIASKLTAEEKRRNAERKARDKAQTIRSTGKLPRTCGCFWNHMRVWKSISMEIYIPKQMRRGTMNIWTENWICWQWTFLRSSDHSRPIICVYEHVLSYVHMGIKVYSWVKDKLYNLHWGIPLFCTKHMINHDPPYWIINSYFVLFRSVSLLLECPCKTGWTGAIKVKDRVIKSHQNFSQRIHLIHHWTINSYFRAFRPFYFYTKHCAQ